MKTIYKYLIIVLTIILVLVPLSSCAQDTTGDEATGSEESEAVADQTLRIGFAQNASDENMNRSRDTMIKFFEDWNAAGKLPKIEFFVNNAEGDIDKNISNIDQFISMDVDVIISSPTDTSGIVPAYDRARAAGIKIVDTRGVDIDHVDVFYSIGEDRMAARAITWWHELLDSNPDLVCYTGGIYGMAMHTEQVKRVDVVFADLEANYPDRFFELDRQYGDWDTGKSMQITENWLQAYPEMNCIIAAGAQMALGAVNAVVDKGGDMDKWVFTTVDATADAFSMLSKGQLDMTVGISVEDSALTQCKIAVALGLDVWTGGKTAGAGPEVTPLIDLTNYEEYMP